MTRKEEIEKGVKYFKDNKQRMSSLYKEMYREDICLTCPGSIEHAFNKMYNDREKIFATIPMKRGKIINTHMWDDSLGIPKGHYTFDNTSDELAKKFIALGYKDYFIL